MKAFLALLVSCVALHASAPPQLLCDSIRKVPGCVAWYDPGSGDLTLNGSGVSQLNNRAVTTPVGAGNMLLQSSDFSTTWTTNKLNPFGAIDTGAASAGSFANTARTTDPLGGNTADFIQVDGTAATTHYITQTPVTSISGVQATAYVFAKMDGTSGGTNIMLYASVAAVGKGFDLNAGTAVAVSGVTAPTASSITSIGSGWYLCSITFTGGASETLRINVLTNSAGTYTRTYTGDSTSGLFLWGASLVNVTAGWQSVTGPTLAQGYYATTTLAQDPVHNLAQATAANQPILDTTNKVNGRNVLYFNGTSHYLKTPSFTLVQPETVVWVGSQVTWTSGRFLLDGNTVSTCALLQHTASPALSPFGGSYVGDNSGLAVNTFGVVDMVLNGASSLSKVNFNAAVAGSGGSANASGFTLGAAGNNNGWANINTLETLVYHRALDTNEQAYVTRLMDRKFNLGF